MDKSTYVQDNLIKGIHCPSCGQTVKLRARKLHAEMARALAVIYRHYRDNKILVTDDIWLKVNDLLVKKGINPGASNFPLLRHFGLLEQKPERKKDGNRAGFYRLTKLGFAFVEGRASVPAHIYTYNNQVYPAPEGEPTITMREALGSKFDYQEFVKSFYPVPVGGIQSELPF